MSIEELFAWAEKYASTPFNMLPLVTATDKQPGPMRVMRSLFVHLERLNFPQMVIRTPDDGND